MPKFLSLLLTLLMLCSISTAWTQCPDFTNLNAPGVVCQYGVFSNPFANTGVVPGRHTLITEQGTDPRTGDQLPLLPPGESQVVKLGNEDVGSEAEAITYSFTVDAEHAILLMKFAVVFQDPNHASVAQPRFIVHVLNEEGEITEACAEYDVTANANIKNFRVSTYGGTTVRWRPWTTVGINLSDYIGQTIKLQFVTYDCDLHGHFGYAYFTAQCISNRLSIVECSGESVTLSAPPSFESYIWDNGTTGEQASYTVPDSGSTATCQITSATGCQFTLSAFISSNDLPTGDSTFYDSVCEGEPYIENHFNLPPQYNIGTFLYQNNFFDNNACGGEYSYKLHLTVLQKYFHIHDKACAGNSYDRYGFHIENLTEGTFTDTLIFSSDITQSGCDSIVILHLTVNPSFHFSNQILGDTHPCQTETSLYKLSNADSTLSYTWDIPTGVNIVSGQGTSAIQLYFSSTAPSPSIIFVVGANGCGSASVPLEIYPQRAHHLFFTDTICSGSTYNNYNFSVARQDSIGYFTFQQDYQTKTGCDSTRVLSLYVVGTPELSIHTDTNLLCNGQSITLHAMGDLAGFIAKDCELPPIAAGDILCTDSSIVKPFSWDTCGKTPWGIVFFVDNTGQHGWAVNLHDESSRALWSNGSIDVPGLPNISSSRNLLKDLDGYENTRFIRNAGNRAQFPAAWEVDFDHGWYLPSTGQFSILHTQIPNINHTLQTIGLNPFSEVWFYWTSTEYNLNEAYNISETGNIKHNLKINGLRVRSIRNF